MIVSKKDTDSNSAASESPDADAVKQDADDSGDRLTTGANASPVDTTGAAAQDYGQDVADEHAAETPQDAPSRSPRRLSISVGAASLAYALLIAILVGALATFVWLYVDAQSKLDANTRKSDNYAHAEKIALDYAVNAAAMNFQDLAAWKSKLVAGTSQELNGKLTKAAESMEQILIPLQWTSSAQPLVAKVRSDTGGFYAVDCFVGVQTKTVQAPDALQSTATYSLTLDSSKNWKITDVGGIGAVVGEK